jgi:hypothetical protein
MCSCTDTLEKEDSTKCKDTQGKAEDGNPVIVH